MNVLTSNRETIEMLPCPMCGCPNISISTDANAIECVRCGLRTRDCQSITEAIESWNTRSYAPQFVVFDRYEYEGTNSTVFTCTVNGLICKTVIGNDLINTYPDNELARHIVRRELGNAAGRFVIDQFDNPDETRTVFKYDPSEIGFRQ